MGTAGDVEEMGRFLAKAWRMAPPLLICLRADAGGVSALKGNFKGMGHFLAINDENQPENTSEDTSILELVKDGYLYY